MLITQTTLNSTSVSLLLSLLTACFAGCRGDGPAVETVPPAILDPDRYAAKAPVVKRVEYKLSDKASTKIFPAPTKNVYTTASGLSFVVFKRGTEHSHPSSTTNVTVHYEGFTSDGKRFDSSIARKEPTSFVLNQVIPGWREGVKLMTVGDSFRFWIPEKDAYRGAPGKPAGLLIFDVELIAMEAE